MSFRCFRLSLAVFLVAVVVVDVDVSAADTKPLARPNIVVINLDDADAEILSDANLETHYPAFKTLATRSMTFTNAHSTTPFCAPSRAAFFTGKYAFNNGCRIAREGMPLENGFTGGYQRFKSMGHDQNELGVWIRKSGYRTMHIGKFHHSGFDYSVPAGWDDFSATLGARYFGTSKFSNFPQSNPRRFAIGLHQYITDVESKEAVVALDRHFTRSVEQPFFLYLAPLAPHTPLSKDVTKMVHPKYASYADNLNLPTGNPDFNEADVSDKPDMIQRPPLTRSEQDYLNLLYRCRVGAMKSVDEMLEAVIAKIEAAGKLDNTWIIVTSDNGYALGHHRLIAKKDPYNHTSNVPLIVAGPTVTQRTYASHLIAHIDICPTVLELAGVEIPADLDGKSFAPLLHQQHLDRPQSWRRSIMIENWNNKRIANRNVSMAYTAERFYDSIHIGWANGQHEFYEMKSDQFQLENQFGRLPIERQKALVHSLVSFRKPRLPQGTVTSPADSQKVSNSIHYTGYLEDNSVAAGALLTVQSSTTQRYFNGSSWQSVPAYLPVATRSDDTSITQWNHRLSIFADTENGFDVLISSITPVDDEENSGSPIVIRNPLRGWSLFSTFTPFIDGKNFSDGSVTLTGHTGSMPEAEIAVTVVNAKTGLYFNGTTFQKTFCVCNAEKKPGSKWSLKIDLPPGHYRSSTFARHGDQHQHRPAIADFEVR